MMELTELINLLNKEMGKLRAATSHMASPNVRAAVDQMSSAVQIVGDQLEARNCTPDTRQCGTCVNNGVLKCMPPGSGLACPMWKMVEPKSKDDLADEQSIPPEEAGAAIENLRRAIGVTEPQKFETVERLFDYLREAIKPGKKAEVNTPLMTAAEMHEAGEHRQMPIIEALKILQEIYDATKAITELNRWLYEHKETARYFWSYTTNQTVEDLPGRYFLLWKIEKSTLGTPVTATLVYKGPVSMIEKVLLRLKFPEKVGQLIDKRKG